MELGLCVENELRQAHGLELAANDAARQLGIQVGSPEPRPTMRPELESIRVSAESLEDLSAGSAREERTPRVPESPVVPVKISEIPVRSVSVFEHPEHLTTALDSAKKRLLIISPWVKGGVVNSDFIAKLERRLRAGVEVHIGHGIGLDDRGSDEWALEKLTDLAQRNQGKFELVRLKNTHAKILIYDGVWINTSFNWLSFKGDPDRTFRMEEGTLVQIPSEVDRAYNQYVETLRTDAQ